jgi:hypothetical protein
MFNMFGIPNTSARYTKEIAKFRSMKHLIPFHAETSQIFMSKALELFLFITSVLPCGADVQCVQT